MVSLALHGLALLALVLAAPHKLGPLPSGPVLDLALASSPRPPLRELAPVLARPVPKPAAAPAPAEAAALPSPARRRGSPARASVALGGGTVANAEAIGEAELAGAAAAGTGGGKGGDCDMIGRLQAALQGDRLVRAELTPIAASGSRALRIWDGDWVAHPGQEGRGLAAVREAILWEVGFSPPQCRRETMHGLILLAVRAEAGGEVRLALGTGAWRWSDLLGLGAARAS